MIGRLRGTLIHKAPPALMVEVGGVGYELDAPMSTFYDLPELGREVTLFTHYAVKEDSVALYGFLTERERRLFRDVQKVTGIGAKIALAILSGVSVDDFARLVSTSDVTASRASARRPPNASSSSCATARRNSVASAARSPRVSRSRPTRSPKPSSPCSSSATSQPRPRRWRRTPSKPATRPKRSSARH